MFLLGNCAIKTLISRTIVQILEPCRNLATSSSPVLGSRNCIKFNEAKLQAVSSKNIYSLQGLDARIGPSAGHVCHSLIVESN